MRSRRSPSPRPTGSQMVLAPLASMVVNPHLYKNVGYDTLKDLDPVALVADLPLLMVANPSVPVKNVPELIAYAKANPDKLTHPSAGNGTLSHLGFEDLKRRAGITILHVPYQGSPRAMADLVGGAVHVALDTVVVTQSHIQWALAAAAGDRVRPAAAGLPGYADHRRAGLPGLQPVGMARHRRAGRHAEGAHRATRAVAGRDREDAGGRREIRRSRRRRPAPWARKSSAHTSPRRTSAGRAW